MDILLNYFDPSALLDICIDHIFNSSFGGYTIEWATRILFAPLCSICNVKISKAFLLYMLVLSLVNKHNFEN